MTTIEHYEFELRNTKHRRKKLVKRLVKAVAHGEFPHLPNCLAASILGQDARIAHLKSVIESHEQ